MGFEKENSKGGGYVGGFFHLFDWKAKSRKKLFSSKSDSPELSKQGKRSYGNLPVTQYHLMDEDDTGLGPFTRGGSNYSCASSMTDEDGYKAPGVVARLMGLDSLPTSNFVELDSSPYFDAQSLREASQRRKHVEYYHNDQIRYSGHLLIKDDGFSQNFMEPKSQKVISRPIEKFQTEILPPKSAKSIPITHHKLLSPIKSHSFIPGKTAAHIMEAAAKIIEHSPQVPARAKTPLVRSSSAPLKVRELKEKLESAQKVSTVGSSSMTAKAREFKERAGVSYGATRTAEDSRKPLEHNSYSLQSNSSKYLRGQPLNKSWNGSVDTNFSPGEGHFSSKSKGKSVSLALQAKVNVQKREGLSASSTQSLTARKEKNDTNSNQSFRSQPNSQKSMHKSAASGLSALRQNNQKQNCRKEKEILSSKPATSSLQGRKEASGGSVRHITSEKNVESETGSRKTGYDGTNSRREISNNALRNAPRKKRFIDDSSQSKKIQPIETTRRASKSNSTVDRRFAEEQKMEGMDVVSFTFTAPLSRPMHGSMSPCQVGQRTYDDQSKRSLLDTNGLKLSSVGVNMIGGEDLNTLLEQKLKELTSTVGSSYNSAKLPSTFGSASTSRSTVFTSNSGVTAPWIHDFAEELEMYVNKSVRSHSSDVFSADSFDPFSLDSTLPDAFRLKQMTIQGVDDIKDSIPFQNANDSRMQLDCRRPSPVSVLETSSMESSHSFESANSSYIEGSKPCSSIQDQEFLGLSSSKRIHYVDAEMELTDSASSTFVGVLSGEAHTQTVSSTSRSTSWEVDYVKQMLSNFDWMFRDFALGRSQEIVNPHLFNQLENRKSIFESDTTELRQERKLLFDCVSECLDIRCTQYVDGGYRTWTKGMSIIKRRNWLAEEVHKEITMWRGMWDYNVDELVDKDMSSPLGRWLDFEVDGYAVGVEVEDQILDLLVDEVVADFLLYRC